jgi:hypothetical protein
MWAVGTLVETTLDVNLVTLWTRGIVRIFVSMVNPKALEKHVDVSGPYNGVAYVVKLKLYEFFFHREASYFVPDPASSLISGDLKLMMWMMRAWERRRK